ncbi:glycine and tyrosine-rich protein-like [Panonychus citri]|uniref:glycine and tyrosine-rich protein-like n=1 Tax=Panonychus citri TaxID=50023 RepID=UPI0023072703|nr:glycine and tyrosine-rich protein-like [Panonychus citri]
MNNFLTIVVLVLLIEIASMFGSDGNQVPDAATAGIPTGHNLNENPLIPINGQESGGQPNNGDQPGNLGPIWNGSQPNSGSQPVNLGPLLNGSQPNSGSQPVNLGPLLNGSQPNSGSQPGDGSLLNS